MVVEVSHPDEQMLLAYLRQQPYEEWPGGMQQHIIRCPVCQQRTVTLMQVSLFLETWARSRTYQDYPSLTGRVLQQINQPQSVFEQLANSVYGAKARFTSIPVTVALLLLLGVVVLAFGYRHVPLPAGAGSDHLVPTATVVVPLIPPQPHPTKVAQPVQHKGQKEPTPGASPGNNGSGLPQMTPTITAPNR